MLNLYKFYDQPEELDGYEIKDTFLPEIVVPECVNTKKRVEPWVEKIIAMDSLTSVTYAREVLKRRWPEAEEEIKKWPGEWKRYQAFLAELG